jgi:hypothetical protein
MDLRTSTHPPVTAPRRPASWTYVWWAATGALMSLGVASLLTVGIFLLAGTAVLLVVGLSLTPVRRGGHVGALAGLSVAPLYLAWLNRQGPGTVCEAVRDGTRCEDLWSPWPFLAAGLVFLAVAAAVGVRAGHRRSAVVGRGGDSTRCQLRAR